MANNHQGIHFVSPPLLKIRWRASIAKLAEAVDTAAVTVKGYVAIERAAVDGQLTAHVSDAAAAPESSVSSQAGAVDLQDRSATVPLVQDAAADIPGRVATDGAVYDLENCGPKFAVAGDAATVAVKG